MNLNDNSPCRHAEMVRDYAFDELAQADRRSMEQHFTQCSDCAGELDRLRLTTAVLRVLPEQEVPRRIAFVSDKVFERNWLGGFWNSAARLGFAAACVLAIGMYFAAWRFTTERRGPEVVAAGATAGVSRAALDDAVNKAVALAVDKVHADDMQLTRAAVGAVDARYSQQERNLMVAMQSNLEFLQKRYQTTARVSYLDAPGGAGQ